MTIFTSFVRHLYLYARQLMLGFCLLFANINSGYAATFIVTTLDGDAVPTEPCSLASCTLRQAIDAAEDETTNPGADTIVFANGLTGDLLLNVDDTPNDPARNAGSSAFYIATEITINGDNLSADGTEGLGMIKLNAQQQRRIFTVEASGSLTVNGLTLSNGFFRGGPSAAGFGGAVFNFGDFTLTNSTLINNSAAGGNGNNPLRILPRGAGIGGGNLAGGFASNGVENGTFGANGSNGAFGIGGQGGGTLGGNGGNGGFGAAGGNGSTTFVSRSVPGFEGIPMSAGFTGNGGNGGFGGGGGSGGGGIDSNRGVFPGRSGFGGFGGGNGAGRRSTVDLLGAGSTFSGGGMGAGGAIFQFSGSLTLINTTLSSNQVINGKGVNDPESFMLPSGDGAALGSALFVYGGTTSINHSSIVDNNPNGVAPPIYVFAASPSSLTIQSSLVVDDSACAGTAPTDAGGNLASSGCGPIVATPITGLARNLADNGGPSPTFALTADSNAVDLATVDILEDQRGLTRPQGNASDSGAYEVEQALTVSLSSIQVNEQDGTAVLTVSRFGSLSLMPSITISSSSPGDASVTTPVLSLGANQTAASTLISIVDNDLIDGLRTVTFTASAAGFSNGVASLNISDNDLDGDEDGIANQVDNCPAIANADQANLDGDNQGDACDSDIDGDTIANAADNCPLIVNTNQNNFDGDSQGDACDSDDDNDGLPDDYETANGLNPLDPSDASADADNDGFSNIEEFEAGSDPQVADTDNNNNGVPDSVEKNSTVIVPTLQLLLLDEE